MSSLLRACVVVAALAAFGAIAGAVSASPSAEASKSCSVGSGRGYGTTYVTKLSVRHTTCARGKDVVRAFHACRPGKAGHCHHRVLGYRCREHRYNKIPTQYDSNVTCTRGSKVVKHTYTQFT
jgi:hypothetical protein